MSSGKDNNMDGKRPFLFSCEKTQKMAEEIAQEMRELEDKNLHLFDDSPEEWEKIAKIKFELMQAAFIKNAEIRKQREEMRARIREQTIAEFGGNGWINVDKHWEVLHIVSLFNKCRQEEANLAQEISNMTVDEPHPAGDDITDKEDIDKEVKDLVTNIRDTKQCYLSEEMKDDIMKLTESQKINLLKSLSDSENCIAALCLTVADKMESRDQSVFAALLCTHLLVHKAKQCKLEGDLYAALSRLIASVPYIMGNFFLLPMLLNGGDSQKQASQLIDSCEVPTLRHSVFRSWVSEKNRQNFSELDFDLLKMFLKTAVRDAESVRTTCVLFSNISELYSTNMNFAKFVLLFIKSHHNLIGEEAKKKLSSAIAFNKTSFAKVLEKELAKIK